MSEFEKTIAWLEQIIVNLKGTLVAEYASQYREDGERGTVALEMAKEDAELALTIATNTATKIINERNR